MEKVSIITPLYNAKSFFNETFNSVVNQTYTDFEWIIVDDCSSDGSYEYVLELAKKETRIKLFKLESNKGTGGARNFGLKAASGRYITFLDSDDLLDPNYLEEQVCFIKKNGPIISSGYRRMANNSITDFYVPEVVDYKSLLKTCALSCLTTMYDKQVIGDVFFPENMHKAEDYPFWLNILKKGYAARGNHKILASYRILGNSRSRNKFSLIKHIFFVYHNTQHINCVKSWFYVLRWALNGLKKYKDVK